MAQAFCRYPSCFDLMGAKMRPNIALDPQVHGLVVVLARGRGIATADLLGELIREGALRHFGEIKALLN